MSTEPDGADARAPLRVALPKDDAGRLDTRGGSARWLALPDDTRQVIATPDGWMALVSRTLGSGKAVLGYETELHTSRDGLSWQQLPLDLGDDLYMRGLAYGNGHYVMVGRQASGVVYHSTDGRAWEQTLSGLDLVDAWGGVAYVGERFIAHGWTLLGSSPDGVSWTQTREDVVQTFGLAHGHGLYMITGSGPVITSSDALNWSTHPVDCALPEACVTDPSGGMHPIMEGAVFDGERFFAGRLSSVDGVRWERSAPLPVHAFVDGQYLHVDDDTLSFWTRADPRVDTLPIASAVPPGNADVSCQTASCLAIGGGLLLIPPPPGT